MTTIQRLGIQGIRSYGPDQEQSIAFTPPLTLIVGSNGCGKTTVIESLRMATCGVLPPNSGSGQAFVHDPRVSFESSTETKAKIRLKFQATNNTTITVSRLFNLTNKKGPNRVEKQQYKQLEGSVQFKENVQGSERKSITNKCAEIDKLIPELMGVSQAVLQNVIFCHQEESNWILGEPKVLKDKFDAIFASTRYSKALEQVKKTQAELKLELKDFEKDEAQQKEIKRHAHEFKHNLKRRETDRIDTESKKKDLETEIANCQKRLDKCHDGLKQYREHDEYVKESKQKIATWVQERDKVDGKIKHYLEESTEELKTQKRHHEKALQDNDSAMRKYRDEVEKSKAAVDECSETLSGYETQHSRLQATQDVMKGQEGERSKLANRIADTYGMDKALVPVPFERAPSIFCRELTNKYEAKKKDGDTRKRANQRALDAIQEEVVKASSEHDREQQAIELRKKLIKDKVAEIARVERSIQELSYDEDELPKLEEKKEQLKRDMSGLGRSPETIQVEIDSKTAPRQRATEKRNKLQEEMKARQADQEKIAFVKRDKQELETLKKDLEEKMDQHGALQTLLGYRPKLDEAALVTDTVKQELEESRIELKDATEEHLKAKTEVGRIDRLLQSKAEERERLNKQMKDLIAEAKATKVGGAEVKGLVEAVEGALGAASFDALIAGLEQKKEKKQKAESFASSMKNCVGLFEDHQAKNHTCPLCDRAISPGSDVLRTFESKLSEFLADFDHSDSKQKIVAFEKQIVALQQARDKKAQAGTVQAQAQELAVQEDDLKQERERAERQLEDADDKQRRAQERYDKTENVNDFLRQLDLANLDRLKQKIAQAEAELSSRDLKQRDILDLEQEHSAAEKQAQDLEIEIQKLWNEKTTMVDELQKRTRLYNDVRDKVNACERKKESHDEKSRHKDEIKREMEKLEQENRNRIQQLPELDKKREDSKAKILRQRKEYEGEDRQNDLDITEMWQQMAKLQDYENKIAEFKQQKLDKEEQRLKGLIDQTKAKLQDAKDKHTTAKDRAGQIADTSCIAQLVREIEDNLSWRDYRDKIKTLEDEMKDRGEELDQLPSKKELRDLATQYEAQVVDKNNEVQRMEGKLQSLQQQIKDLEKKLKEKEYVDIDTKYRKTQIGIETKKGASKDLDKYYAALDKALMRFHEMKMEEINKYVKEYWQTTYKGDDIETIEIKADLENQANRRSHNYRLVMRHRHMSELDMRGRCSAGQKVLASLVVRLALAETFCHNCGVLALDEPTSNLDEQNIGGFTEALSRIVNDRKQAKNNGFQLIVISHDNEFIDNLARLTEVPTYFRLKKDPRTQYSIITEHDVQDIG